MHEQFAHTEQNLRLKGVHKVKLISFFFLRAVSGFCHIFWDLRRLVNAFGRFDCFLNLNGTQSNVENLKVVWNLGFQ